MAPHRGTANVVAMADWRSVQADCSMSKWFATVRSPIGMQLQAWRYAGEGMSECAEVKFAASARDDRPDARTVCSSVGTVPVMRATMVTLKMHALSLQDKMTREFAGAV